MSACASFAWLEQGGRTVNPRGEQDCAGRGGGVRENGRRRFAHGLLAGVSAVALGAYTPAFAQEWRQEARAPELGLPLRDDSPPAQLAQAGGAQHFAIPPGDLRAALLAFSQQVDIQLIYPAELTAGLRTGGVQGDYTPERALELLLAGTGIRHRFTSANAVSLERAVAGEDGGPWQLDAIIVEDTRPYASQYEVDEGFKADFQSSATKTPLPIRQTPQSVSVVTQDSIEERQAQDLGQALETVAGVSQYSGTGPYAGKSPFGFDEVQIRGVALDGALDIREDGFVSPTFFSQPDLTIYERVEAVKGPSSVLYGRGSAGGFINRVRKKPLPEAQFEAAAEAGSFDHYRAEADVTGPMFESERLRGRLVAAYQDTGSFVDDVDSERTVVAPGLEVDVTESTRLLLLGHYQKDRFIPNPGFPLQSDGNKFRAPDIGRSLFVGVANDDKNEWEVFSGSAQVEQELGEDWLATVRLNKSAQNSPVDIDSYAYGINAAGDVYLYSAAFDFDTDTWSGELKLDGKVDLLGRPTNLTFGLDHFDNERARTDAFVPLGTANIYDENFDDFPTIQPTTISRDAVTRDKSTGVYGQVMIEPTQRLHILLGGRYDWADSTYIDNLADTESQKKDEAFTGRVGITYDVLDNVSVYGLYAQSFSPVTAVARGGEILDPEEGEIWEAGVKTEWLDGKLGANFAVFRIERSNVPIPDPSNGPGEFFNIASGLQRSDGVELELNGAPLPVWNVSFGGILLDSEFVEQDDPFHGSKPAGTADWQVGLFTSYELQDGPLKGLGLGAGLFAIGDRGISTFQAGGELDGYERVDLKAFYNGFEPFKIGLQVRNLFDEKYVEGADRTGAYAQFGAPRAVLLTVRAKW